MLKALGIFAVLALICASATSKAQSLQAPTLEGSSRRFPNIDVKAVRMVRCTGGHGTGFVIAGHRIMTAYHVVNGQAECADGETGQILKLVYWNQALDIAVFEFRIKHPPRPMKINCEGYSDASTYYSYGYAGMGNNDLMITRIRATDKFVNGIDSRFVPFTHMRSLNGVVIPGMSGGPIIDDRGRVTGMNNLTAGQFRLAISRELKATYICAR